MAIPIIRKGTTGSAAPWEVENCNDTGIPSMDGLRTWQWIVRRDPGGTDTQVGTKNSLGAGADNGWNVTSGADVTVPANAQPGLYMAIYSELGIDKCGTPTGTVKNDEKRSPFIVPCLLAKPAVSSTPSESEPVDPESCMVDVTVTTAEEEGFPDPPEAGWFVSVYWYRLATDDPALDNYDLEDEGTWGTAVGSGKTLLDQELDKEYRYTAKVELSLCSGDEDVWCDFVCWEAGFADISCSDSSDDSDDSDDPGSGDPGSDDPGSGDDSGDPGSDDPGSDDDSDSSDESDSSDGSDNSDNSDDSDGSDNSDSSDDSDGSDSSDNSDDSDTSDDSDSSDNSDSSDSSDSSDNSDDSDSSDDSDTSDDSDGSDISDSSDDGSDGSDSSDASDESDEPPIVEPPAPCIFDLETIKVEAVSLVDWYPGADFYSLEFNPSGVWTEVATDVDPGETVIAEFPYEAELRARWVAHVGETLVYSDEAAVENFCCYGVLPPEVPDTPGLAKDCEAGTVTVTSPAFSTTESRETESVEIRRRALPDGAWQNIHTFNSATTWDDETVEVATEYEYQARACNEAGCSDWSEGETISLVSETLALAWLSPEADTEVLRIISLRFSAEDSGGPASEFRIEADGITLGTVKLLSGTATDGTHGLTWNTRHFWEGATTLVALAKGSDGCWARAELPLVVANTFTAGTLYRDDVIALDRAGKHISALRVSVETGPLSPADVGRYWCQVGVRKDELEPVDADTPVEQADEEWAAHQLFPMEQSLAWPARGIQQAGAIYACRRSLNHPGDPIFVRRKLTPSVHVRYFQTGLDQVQQIVEMEEGLFWIFARNTDGSGAKIFTYDGETFAIVYNLHDWLAENATAIAPSHDGVVALVGGQLLLVDIAPLTDPRDAAQLLLPRRGRTVESRPAKFLLPISTAATIVLYGDDDATQAYRRSSGGFSPIWSLAEKVSLAKAAGAKILLAVGPKLFVSEGIATPVLEFTFTHSITALDEGRVGLANGQIWELVEDAWSLVTGLPSAANDLGVWTGSREEEFTIVAGSDGWLRWPNRAGAWADGIAIVPPIDEDFTKLLCLARYRVEVETPGNEFPGTSETEPVYDERILFGGDGGVFGELALSKLSEEDGAFLCTGQEGVALIPTWRTVPPVVEEEE